MRGTVKMDNWNDLGKAFTPAAFMAGMWAMYRAGKAVWNVSAAVTRSNESMEHTAAALLELSENYEQRCRLEDSRWDEHARRYEQLQNRVTKLEQKG